MSSASLQKTLSIIAHALNDVGEPCAVLNEFGRFVATPAFERSQAARNSARAQRAARADVALASEDSTARWLEASPW